MKLKRISLKAMRNRLCDALRLLRSDRYWLHTSDRFGSDEGLLYGSALLAAQYYIERVTAAGITVAGHDSVLARLDMLRTIMDTHSSVIVLSKEYGQCYAACDCHTQADLDELMNQQIA